MNIKLIVGILFLGIIFCCTKDEPSGVEALETAQVETRTGKLRWVFDSTTIVLDNYMLTDEKNVQILFNKDSISIVRLVKSDNERVYIGRKLHGVYNLTIVSGVDTFRYENVFAPYTKQLIEYKPAGVNYKGPFKFMKFTRDDDFIKYYDITFAKFKIKYKYTVETENLRYTDYIPSLLNNSNVFKLIKF
jgi:hypothetical protein